MTLNTLAPPARAAFDKLCADVGITESQRAAFLDAMQESMFGTSLCAYQRVRDHISALVQQALTMGRHEVPPVLLAFDAVLCDDMQQMASALESIKKSDVQSFSAEEFFKAMGGE